MSRKKNEVLSIPLTNSTEFQDFITGPSNLSVIDCYPKWCGPCKSIVSYFKRLKLEAGDSRLKFGTACIEDCEQLSILKDTEPEPLFLFYASGILVARVHGCSGPNLTNTTLEMLRKETEVDSGNAERVEISLVETKNTGKSNLTAKESFQSIGTGISDDADKEANKQVTFSIITSSYLDRVEDILDELSGSGVEVLEMRQIQLTEEDVRAIKPNMEESQGWEAWLEYMTSSTSCCIILTRVGDLGVGIVSQMNLLTGPLDQNVAEKEAPDSINSLYGSMAMYTTPSESQALAAINRIFPSFTPPNAIKSSQEMQDNEYKISGASISEEIEGKLKNFGCSVVDQGEGFLKVSCARSLDNLRQMVESIGEGLEVALFEE